MGVSGISKSFRPRYTGVIFFPVKARAPVPPRQSIPWFRPIMDLQRIRISPSLQAAGYMAMHTAAAAVEEPLTPSTRYESFHSHMNPKGELAPIRDTYIDSIQQVTVPMAKQLPRQESDINRQDPQNPSASSVGAKWWLLLLCAVLVWYMRPGDETNRQKLPDRNHAPIDLRTRIQRNRDSEFEFMQMLVYEMSMRSNRDGMALG
ncbi:hypothetical protein BDV26DRAFT_271692 [Aspergillus bertholletiae]|uniref:Uncharacterized protein n=1 Tax=Aspergillus bertholletiae TaxID=1226010 RepID=A0A5N7AUU2_9EURO|nr:hypothetical protein BDV26DRAFT_271692 [Aspergillus bertholletiae]